MSDSLEELEARLVKQNLTAEIVAELEVAVAEIDAHKRARVRELEAERAADAKRITDEIWRWQGQLKEAERGLERASKAWAEAGFDGLPGEQGHG